MTSVIRKLAVAALAVPALATVALGPTAGTADAHYWDTCRADLESRAEAEVTYQVVCHTDKVHDEHRLTEVTLHSTRRPFTSASIRHYHGSWTPCEVTGKTARCAAPPGTLESAYVSARLDGPLSCGTRAASYLRVDAVYDGGRWEGLGPYESWTAKDYERYGRQSPGPCFSASLDVISADPRKAHVGERTCVRFELGSGRMGPEDYYPDQNWERALKGAKLRFAGKTTKRFSRSRDRFKAVLEAKVCKRFSKPGRYEAKLTRPSDGDIHYFSGLKEKVKVRR